MRRNVPQSGAYEHQPSLLQQGASGPRSGRLHQPGKNSTASRRIHHAMPALMRACCRSAAGCALTCSLLRRAEAPRPSVAHQMLLRGAAYGELDHPDADSPYFKRINRENASHRVLDLWWVGNDLHATVQVLDTRQGDLIRDIYTSGRKCALPLPHARCAGANRRSLPAAWASPAVAGRRCSQTRMALCTSATTSCWHARQRCA